MRIFVKPRNAGRKMERDPAKNRGEHHPASASASTKKEVKGKRKREGSAIGKGENLCPASGRRKVQRTRQGKQPASLSKGRSGRRTSESRQVRQGSKKRSNKKIKGETSSGGYPTPTRRKKKKKKKEKDNLPRRRKHLHQRRVGVSLRKN